MDSELECDSDLGEVKEMEEIELESTQEQKTMVLACNLENRGRVEGKLRGSYSGLYSDSKETQTQRKRTKSMLANSIR